MRDDNGVKMKPSDIKVDPEFAKLLPPPTADELKRLRESVRANGFEDPLTVWKEEGVLVDGHNRLELWRTDAELDGAEPLVRLKSFEDRDAAKRWMLDLQLSRRNLKKAAWDAAVAARYELEKNLSKPRGRKQKTPEKIDSKKGADSAPNSDGKARERTAEAAGVSPRTVDAAVKRDSDRKLAIAAIRSADSKFADQIEAGSLSVSDADVRAIGKLGAAKIREAAKRIRLDEDWKGDPPPKKSKPAKGKEVSPAKLVDELRKKHVGPLTRGLDAVAEMLGGAGANHKAALEAMDVVEKSLKAMRGGAK